MASELGFTEAVSIALGGMIGGGIYAVLGVVTGITGATTWFAFALAGVVAVCAGYSYNALNDLSCGQGGSVTFVQCFTGNATLAGVVGWTLLFGYVGSMAMYAFAFAEFALSFRGVPSGYAGVPLRPVVSVLVVGGFVALNFLGTRATGAVENILVSLKVGVLVLFGVGGLAYATFVSDAPVVYDVTGVVAVDPWVAAGVSFVAFQGWQLLFYDQERIVDPIETVRRAVYVAIAVAVAIYVLVAVATYNLAPAALASHPHTALKDAAETALSAVGLAGVGGAIIALSALFSTGSAINATLFSAAHFAKGMLSEGLLPDQVGDPDVDGVPPTTVLGLGAVTAALAVYGSLSAITNFASVAFIAVFGSMSYLAFRQREREGVNPVIPAVGVCGALGFLPLMLYQLFRESPHTLWMVALLAIGSVSIELLYFKRAAWMARVTSIEELADGVEDGVESVFDPR